MLTAPVSRSWGVVQEPVLHRLFLLALQPRALVLTAHGVVRERRPVHNGFIHVQKIRHYVTPLPFISAVCAGPGDPGMADMFSPLPGCIS